VDLLAESLDSGVAENMPHRHVLLPVLVRLALATGDTARAAAAAQAAASEAEREPLAARTAAAGHCRGLIEGEPAPMQAAVAYYQASGRPLFRAQVLEDLAVVHGSRGEFAEARTVLREAIATYSSLGAEWDILRADTRLRAYGVRRRRQGVHRPQNGWEALTPTEVKIAYLVAEGLSNPDIGARLFLSWRTVRFHVSAIMAKLQVDSRIEIAREAARHPAGREQSGRGGSAPGHGEPSPGGGPSAAPLAGA
jgi:DNA-binding CsgD family transcriptional regulator